LTGDGRVLVQCGLPGGFTLPFPTFVSALRSASCCKVRIALGCPVTSTPGAVRVKSVPADPRPSHSLVAPLQFPALPELRLRSLIKCGQISGELLHS
jgi:hypothetical protein